MIHPIWKGFITFGLVNIPVILYTAEKKSELKFKLIDTRDQAKIRYLRINEQTGKEVPWNKVGKGYEYDDDAYVILKDADLKTVSGEHAKTIDILHFIEQESIDSLEFEKPYYLVPDKNSEKGYVILREVLRKTHKFAICKVIIHTREYLAALLPNQDALVLNLLRYPQELRDPAEFTLPKSSPQAYKISAGEMSVAKQLVDLMTVTWDTKRYHDEFKESLEKYIKANIGRQGKKKPMKAAKTTLKKTNVINFMNLLKKSLTEKKSKPMKKTKVAAKHKG
jgi:DNA end-binding protein Ku